MAAPSVDLVVPVYNEGPNIKKTLEAFARNTRDVPASLSVSIVYDFEEDDTLPVVREMASGYPYPIRFVRNAGRGVCSALKLGMRESKCDYVLVTMADCCDDYASVPGMVKLAAQGYDVVCGSRYMPGGRQIGGPAFKRFLSRLAGRSLHLLTGIPTSDITNSFKIYRQELIQGMSFESTGGFEIAMELTAKAFLSGFRIAEVPTTWRARTVGDSRFDMARWLPLYLRWYLFLLFGKRS